MKKYQEKDKGLAVWGVQRLTRLRCVSNKTAEIMYTGSTKTIVLFG